MGALYQFAGSSARDAEIAAAWRKCTTHCFKRAGTRGCGEFAAVKPMANITGFQVSLAIARSFGFSMAFHGGIDFKGSMANLYLPRQMARRLAGAHGPTVISLKSFMTTAFQRGMVT